MERIQSAIAKARAARDRLAPDGTRPTGTATDHDPKAAAWAALAPFTPKPRHLSRNRLVAGEDCDNAIPFDILRTRMLRELATHGWRRVAVTSPDAGCGKSTLTANLALSLSRQAQVRTLLAEFDLRRPSQARMWGLDRPVRFAEALAAGRAAESELVRVGENLALGLNQGAVGRASELLTAPATGAALDRLDRLLAPTVTLFDLPPALRTDDTLAFLDRVDCTLIVAEAEVTTREALDLCEREVSRHRPVLGIVLNKLRHVDKAYGYGY